MSKVRSKDTSTELQVRKAIHRAGFRYRLHRSDLPGKPDVVLSRYHVALFVHGCFWHRHGCKRTTSPTTNADFWSKKFRRTIDRDRMATQELHDLGWTTIVIWECQLRADTIRLIDRLTAIKEAFVSTGNARQSLGLQQPDAASAQRSIYTSKTSGRCRQPG